MSAPAQAVSPEPSSERPTRWHFEGFWLQLAVFAVAFLIICLRRPDAVLNAQFYAEDGVVHYRDAYYFGAHSLFQPYGGYFQIVPRLAGLFAQLFPFAIAPLIMNLIAIAVQVLPLSVFLSSRFSNVKFGTRLLASAIYLALPNSFEINATLTNVQSHLVLLACLLLLAEQASTRVWKVFDVISLVLTSLSSPMGILLLPVAALRWWNTGATWSAACFGFLLPGSLIQTISVLFHWHSREATHYSFSGQPIINGGALGANLHYFVSILGRQVFLSSLLGLQSQGWILKLHHAGALEVFATLIGLSVLIYAVRRGPTELKLFILYAAAVLALALMNPLAGPPDHPQWYWLSQPGCGNRYYFLPMLAFLSSLVWLATRRNSARRLRFLGLALLLLLPIGIYRDWHYPPFINLRFQQFAQTFEKVPAGARVMIPINPGWWMELTKR
jgi:hypothetical protein